MNPQTYSLSFLATILLVATLNASLPFANADNASLAEAKKLFVARQYTPAINMMEELYRQSPEHIVMLDNIAAAYVNRGVEFAKTVEGLENAANDYRAAIYYLSVEWPDGQPSTNKDHNLKTAQDNLRMALLSQKVNVNSVDWHMQKAKALRSKGLLPQAFVEYVSASKLSPQLPQAWEAQGDILTVRRRYSRAIKAYEKAMSVSKNNASDDRDNAALLVKLGTGYQQNEDAANAATSYTKAIAIEPNNLDALLGLEQLWAKEIRTNPNNAAAHANLGTVYQKLKRYPEAQRAYGEALRRDPMNLNIKFNMASLFTEQGSINQAQAVYDDILRTNPNNPQALQGKLALLADQGSPEVAFKQLSSLLPTSNNKHDLLNKLLAVAQRAGQPAQVQAMTKQAWLNYANATANDAQAQYDAGLALHELKEYPQAIGFYSRAIELNPNFADAYANLGSAYVANNQPSEAQMTLKKALQLNPTLAQAKQLQQSLAEEATNKLAAEAATLLNNEQYTQAAQAYAKLAAQNPNQADTQAYYGLALQGDHQLEKALLAFDKAILLDPKNANYYYYKAHLLFADNKPNEAKPLFQKALSLDATLAAAQQELSDLMAQQSSLKQAAIEKQLNEIIGCYDKQQYLKAVGLAELLLASSPNNAKALYYKGLSLEELKQGPKALVAYQKAVAADPNYGDAWYALGVLQDTLGQKAAAKKAFEQFLQKTTATAGDTYVDYAQQRIKEL